LLAFASPASGGPGTADATEERLGGANRYATAAAIALQTDVPIGVATEVVVVNGENFPDGLAASALGNKILLTRTEALPAETLAAMKAICAVAGPTCQGINVTIVGGESAVSSDVYEDLDELVGGTVTRLYGADRYATALKVAKSLNANPADVIIATGTNFPDALAAGPLARAVSAPIVLTQGAALDSALKSYIATASGTIHIIGGESAVPKSIATEISGMGKTVNRIDGDDRAETAVEIAKAIAKANQAAPANLVLVNSDSFADALAAGPFAASAGAHIMLVGSSSIPAATAGWHAANCNSVGGVWAMGGTASISDAVLDGASDATGCAAAKVTSATLASTDVKQATCELNGNVGTSEGVMLTAVPGSIADGAAGNDWSITVTDVAPGNADIDVDTVQKTILVKLVVPDATAPAPYGMTQQQLVNAWNALGADAAKYFVPTVTAKNGAPKGYNNTNPGACIAGSANPATGMTSGQEKQVITVTFNQPVGNTDNALGKQTVLELSDFQLAAPHNVSVISPLIATPGGASVYVIKSDAAVVDSGDLFEVGDVINVAENNNTTSAWSAQGIAVDHTVNVKLTAG
jgi:putative cell wall-binding protein